MSADLIAVPCQTSGVSEQHHEAPEPGPDDRETGSGAPAGPDDNRPSPGDDRESAYELLQRGHDLLTQRHFAQAAIVLERADRDQPGKASILEALGRAYYTSGQHDRSRAAFEELLEIDPSAHYAHFALGQSLKQLGRRDAARTHLRLAVALSPTSTTYAAALARIDSMRPRAVPPGDPGEPDEAAEDDAE
jgi:tetratricopeptide (TPR) repeat protein